MCLVCQTLSKCLTIALSKSTEFVLGTYHQLLNLNEWTRISSILALVSDNTLLILVVSRLSQKVILHSCQQYLSNGIGAYRGKLFSQSICSDNFLIFKKTVKSPFAEWIYNISTKQTLAWEQAAL